MTLPSVELGTVASVERKSVKPDGIGSHLSYVGLENITADGTFVEVAPAGEADIKSNKFAFSSEHILYGKLRPYLSKIAAPQFGGVCSTDIVPIRPGPDIERRFLLHVLRTPAMIGHATRLAVGANLPRLSPKSLETFPIPLPPIEEQRRIAAVLDAADELRAKRREALTNLDTLTRAIFIDMFGGGARPPVNPGAVTEIHPQGWHWIELPSVATMATGHTPDRGVVEYWDGEVGWVNLNEIRRLEGKWCHQTELTITPAGVANSSAVILPVGTVCFSRTASIGFVTALAAPMATSQDFVNWICGDELRPDYLMWAFLMSREALRASSSGSTHRTIYVRDAQRFRVLLPPVELQRQFEERLGSLRAMQETMLGSAPRLDVLFASLHQRAFRGEL